VVINICKLLYQDEDKEQVPSTFYLLGNPSGAIDSLIYVLQGMSDGGIISAAAIEPQNLDPSYGTGNYKTVRDCARLFFALDPYPGYQIIDIPAPKEGLFKIDGETVEPTAVASLAIFLQESFFTDSHGNPIGAFSHGKRCQLPVSPVNPF